MEDGVHRIRVAMGIEPLGREIKVVIVSGMLWKGRIVMRGRRTVDVAL